MKEEIIIAGFGGQGVLSMGKILAYGGIMQDQEVSWLPSYGPEMRGGTCNVSVVLSDNKISSPILSKFDTAIILNQQSMDKFENQVKPGGLLIYDVNGIIDIELIKHFLKLLVCHRLHKKVKGMKIKRIEHLILFTSNKDQYLSPILVP